MHYFMGVYCCMCAYVTFFYYQFCWIKCMCDLYYIACSQEERQSIPFGVKITNGVTSYSGLVGHQFIHDL